MSLAPLANPMPSDAATFLIPGPVNEKDLPRNLFTPNISEKSTVEALVTIVSQDKVRVIRHSDWTKVISRANFTDVDTCINALGIGGIINRCLIHINCLVANLDGVSWESTNTLDELFGFVFGKLKDNNIPRLDYLSVPRE